MARRRREREEETVLEDSAVAAANVRRGVPELPAAAAAVCGWCDRAGGRASRNMPARLWKLVCIVGLRSDGHNSSITG
jgi:hypothetical protein